MARKITQIITILFLSFCAFCTQPIEAIEPQHEYEKPGFNEGHAYDGILPDETIDLFTGGLIIAQRDVVLLNSTSMNPFEALITRRYTSKIFRQQISGPGCTSTGPHGNPEDDFMGQGWSLHFGRLWDHDQFGLPNGHPVLELPNGSRHMFSVDTTFPSRMISKSGWILTQPSPPHPGYEACSPDPDSVCMTLDIKNSDFREGRIVIYPYRWYMYAGTPSVSIHYFNDEADRFWLDDVLEGTSAADPLRTKFNWDTTPPTQTLTSITYYGINDQPLSVTYQYITQNGRKLLQQVSSPQGRTYRYEYDPTTNELIRMKISMDATVDDNDLVIEYTYANHEFKINLFFLSNACTRVVTHKRVKKPDGSFDVWTYQYPLATDSIHKVIVTDPKGNKREVTYQGYSTNQPYVWFVGTILRDEYFEGTTSLHSTVSTYDFKQVSNTPDPEASSYDTLKIPVLLTSTKTFPQTGQQTTTSFGTSGNYDRFGNPDFKTETNFDGSLMRRTDYKYEHRDGDSNDSVMEQNHFVRRLSKIKVTDSGGATLSEVDYEHYSDPFEARFGTVKDELVWDSERSAWVRKTYEYSYWREIEFINEQTEGADWRTEIFQFNSKPLSVIDDLDAEAGSLFHGDMDGNEWVYTATYGPSFQPPTLFTYDLDYRLTQIAPPLGDPTVIDYDDDNRKVTVTQGTSSTVEEYDNRGRLTKRQAQISAGVTSTQSFEYDSLNNLTKQSEKTFDVVPSTFINKTYDALNRVKTVTTVDGTTTYTYNGPDVIVTTQSELGNLVTTMKYDAGGRLMRVIEPNAKSTTYAYDADDRLIRVCHDDNDDICAVGHAFKRSFVYSTRGKLLSETHPESGLTTYKYDLQGRMIEKKFAGQASPILYIYDGRGRVLTVNYPDDADVSFYYDGDWSTRPVPGFESEYYEFSRGHLTGMVDSSGTSLWKLFNINRQLERKDLYLTGIATPITLNYTYDTRGNLASIQYPTGQIVKNYRNDANAINQITRKFGAGSETNLINSTSYNPALLPSNLSYGNGVSLSVSSDLRNRPDVINSTGKLTLDYRYNVRGLIDQIVTGQNGGSNQQRNISYDNLGRLTTFTHSGTSTTNYNFDNFGNMTSKTGPISAGPFTYTNNRINGVSYSPSGNQLTANGKTLVYNQENRITQVSDASTNTFYTYDGQGNRIKVLDALTGKSRYFVYDEAGGLLAELSKTSGGTLYVDKEYVSGPTGTVAVANLDEIPRGLKGYDLNGKIRLEWTPNTNCPIAGYNVYRSTTQNGTYTLLNTGGPVVTGTYDDANIAECTTYWYQIKTVYTGGLEGPASSKFSHKFLNLRAVFYNSPSPGVAPLIETFTYNKAGGCPSVNASNYNIDFGDGFVQNFGTTGTVNRTYTTGSSCYPFCVAKLTVTFTNGVIATQSRLTNMSTNLVTNENFDDGVADGFGSVSGTWSTSSGTYTGSSTGTNWGITLSSSSCNNCVIAAQANTVNQTNKNAYIIFGYVDPANFQYASYDIAANKWAIGDVIAGAKTDRASLTQTLGTGVWHSMEVKLEASSKTVTLKGNGVTRLMYTFTTLYSLPVGLAIKGGQSSFDNYKIAPAYTVTNLHNENFDDGVANGYTPVTGTWTINTSRYRGTIATTTDAVSLTPLSTFNSGIIAADFRVVTGNGYVVFDYVNATNFKFAGIDDTANLWIIGDVISGTKTNRAQFAQTLNPNTSYPSKILLEGATVTLVNSNVIKTRWTFASLTARPVGFGLRGSGTGEFDNALIYTEVMPSGSVANPPAVPVPTSTASPADVATLSYASPPFYYNLNDHLGTARITMNQAGVVTSSVEYYPFGELKVATGCAASSQRFTGKLFDNESGLQYFGARYLSNDLIRFTSVDPAGSMLFSASNSTSPYEWLNSSILPSQTSFDPKIPQSWNLYAYTHGDPMNYIDPNGLDIDNTKGKDPVYYKLEDNEDIDVVKPGKKYKGTHDGVIEPSTGDVYKTPGKAFYQDDVWIDEKGNIHDVNETLGGGNKSKDPNFRKEFKDWENLFKKGDEIKKEKEREKKDDVKKEENKKTENNQNKD